MGSGVALCRCQGLNIYRDASTDVEELPIAHSKFILYIIKCHLLVHSCFTGNWESLLLLIKLGVDKTFLEPRGGRQDETYNKCVVWKFVSMEEVLEEIGALIAGISPRHSWTHGTHLQTQTRFDEARWHVFCLLSVDDSACLKMLLEADLLKL